MLTDGRRKLGRVSLSFLAAGLGLTGCKTVLLLTQNKPIHFRIPSEIGSYLSDIEIVHKPYRAVFMLWEKLLLQDLQRNWSNQKSQLNLEPRRFTRSGMVLV